MSLHNDSLATEEPRQEKRRSCLLIMVSGTIILSLLAASIVSLVWFVTQQTPEMSELPIPGQTNLEDETVDQATTELAEDLSSNLEETTTIAPNEHTLNRIVFVNDERQIETVAPDGSQRRLLTDEDLFYEFPAWSPDGSGIAALGSDRSGGGIFLLHDDEEPGDPQELFFDRNRRPFYLYWSPDSQQISFLANNPVNGIGLNVMDARVGEESRTIASGSPFYWNWTADSKQMLIHSGTQEDDPRLVLIDDAGQDQTPQIPAPGYFQAPGISPSGRFWAYSQLKEGGISWITIDDQFNGEQWAERHAGSIALNWSPVADKLAFISGDNNGRFNFWGPLRLLDIATSKTRLLSSNLVLAFFWSLDGKQIFTISVPNSNGLNGGIEVRETKNRHLARNSQAGPPSQHTMPHQFILSVIDVETGTGLELSEVTLPTIFLSQFLVFFDQYALSHNLWSPDSEQIVLPIIVDDGENQIVVISTKSGRMHQVGSGHMAFWSKQ
jgi:TolB protein